MFDWIRKHKGDALFSLFSSLGIALLFLPVSTVTAVRAAAASALAPIMALCTPLAANADSPRGFDAPAVYQRNLELTAENAKLREAVSRFDEMKTGWDGVKRMVANLDNDRDGMIRGRPAISARLIARPVYKARALYILDRGSDDGVEPGAGIVSRGIVVGRVAAVGRRASLMAPVAHPACQIPAWLTEANAGGQTRGAENECGADTAKLMFVSRRDPVAEGMRVVTSGLDGAFPPGVLIGTVTGVSDEEVAFHDIAFRVALPARDVREVWILKRAFIPLVHDKQGDVDAAPLEQQK